MKTKLLFTMFCFVFSVSGAGAITFSEVPTSTTDPLISGVQFYAGDGSIGNDTYVADFLTPGNNYLLNGYNDGSRPGTGDTFIGVLAPTGKKFASVSFDVLSIYNLPSSGANTTLNLLGILGGSNAGSTSLAISDNSYHTMTLAFLSGGADTLYIYDDLNSFSLGEPFQIDNFTFTLVNDGGVVPEPGTFLLVAAGGGALFFWRKRKETKA